MWLDNRENEIGLARVCTSHTWKLLPPHRAKVGSKKKKSFPSREVASKAKQASISGRSCYSKLVRTFHLRCPSRLGCDTKTPIHQEQQSFAEDFLLLHRKITIRDTMEVAVTKKSKADDSQDYAIKPQAVTPSIDTSTWPLLLKNYDKREYQLIGLGFRQGTREGKRRRRMKQRKLTSIDFASSRPHRSLHPDPQWQLAFEARPQVVHLIRCHQP